MKRIGFSVKIPFLKFIEEYGRLHAEIDSFLCVQANGDLAAAKKLVESIVGSILHSSSYRVGLNFIFLTSNAIEELDRVYFSVCPRPIGISQVSDRSYPKQDLDRERCLQSDLYVSQLSKHQYFSERRRTDEMLASMVFDANFSNWSLETVVKASRNFEEKLEEKLSSPSSNEDETAIVNNETSEAISKDVLFYAGILGENLENDVMPAANFQENSINFEEIARCDIEVSLATKDYSISSISGIFFTFFT
jgi:hypothetical protein